jgi:hypothetical protein
MEKATATMIEKNVFIVLKVSLLTAHVRLSDCRRECAADRPFQFNKSSQLFIRADDETLSVVAMCVCNPDRSPVKSNR